MHMDIPYTSIMTSFTFFEKLESAFGPAVPNTPSADISLPTHIASHTLGPPKSLRTKPGRGGAEERSGSSESIQCQPPLLEVSQLDFDCWAAGHSPLAGWVGDGLPDKGDGLTLSSYV
jgi:hypothetical protein